MHLLMLIQLLGITSSVVQASSLYPNNNLHMKESLLQRRDFYYDGNFNKYTLKAKRDESSQNQKRSYDQTLKYIKAAVESYKREKGSNPFNGFTPRVPVESPYQGWISPSKQPISYPSRFSKDYSLANRIVEAQLAAKKKQIPASRAQPFYSKANQQQPQTIRPQVVQKNQQQFTQQQKQNQPQQQQHVQQQRQDQPQQQQQGQNQQQNQPLQQQQQVQQQQQMQTALSNANMAASTSEGQSALIPSIQTELPPPRPAYKSPPPYIDHAASSYSAQTLPNQTPNQTSPSLTSPTGPQEIVIETSPLLPQEQEIPFDPNVSNVKQDFSADHLNSPSQQSSSQVTSFRHENSQPGFSTTQDGFSQQQNPLKETIQDSSSQQQQQGFMTEPINDGSIVQTEQGFTVPVVEVQQNTPTQPIDSQNEQLDVAIPATTT